MIPVEWVNADEFAAIEDALAAAAAASGLPGAAIRKRRHSLHEQIDQSASSRSPRQAVENTDLGIDLGLKKWDDRSCGTPSRWLSSWARNDGLCWDNQIPKIGFVGDPEPVAHVGQPHAVAGSFEEVRKDEGSGANGSDIQSSASPQKPQMLGDPWRIVRPGCTGTKQKVPYLKFRGRIAYSSTISEAEQASLELLHMVEAKKAVSGGSIPLGFDTEWKVDFKRGVPPRKVAVLQLCVDADRCDVFHTIHSGISSTLLNLLEDSSILKVGVGAYGDARKLHRDYNVKVKGIVELGNIAKQKLRRSTNDTHSGKNWSLSSLAQELTCKQVEKVPSVRIGNWETGKLSEQQLQYAATDAFASLHLYQVLMTFPDHTVKETQKTVNTEGEATLGSAKSLSLGCSIEGQLPSDTIE